MTSLARRRGRYVSLRFAHYNRSTHRRAGVAGGTTRGNAVMAHCPGFKAAGNGVAGMAVTAINTGRNMRCRFCHYPGYLAAVAGRASIGG